MKNIEAEYIDFASKISFFEFIQDEFYKPLFNVDDYGEECELLIGKLTIEKISKILETNPKVIDIFEELFQLMRFTNAQYIHFCFDVLLLNNSDQDTILRHSEKSILRFENGSENRYFLDFYNKYKKDITSQSNEKVYCLKKSIISYINRLIKKREIFYNHLKNSISSRLRVARYLIENLKADDFIESIDLRDYLKVKRHPKDTKGIHGNFGKIKITNALEEYNIKNVDNILVTKTLSNKKSLLPDKFKNKFSYATEKKVNGILKRQDKKLKIFDFIILYDRKPVILIETNFYSTTGTKIDINQNEYTDLKEDIENFNRENHLNLKFMWITDGNYWLTSSGKNRFINLKSNFFKNDYELLNYNLLKEKLSRLLEEIKNEE